MLGCSALTYELAQQITTLYDGAMEPSDGELLVRWRQGEREAGKVLFERYYETLERFFANKIPEGISDLVQETFRLCLGARDQIKDPSKFRSYLFSVAYNVLRGHCRKRGRRGTEVDLEDAPVESLLPGPCSVLIEREEQRLLLEALRRIPVNAQFILELQYWEDLKVNEIADILKVPTGTVKSRLSTARDHLRAAIQALASSPEILESTLTDLEAWARQCRRAFGRSSTESP